MVRVFGSFNYPHCRTETRGVIVVIKYAIHHNLPASPNYTLYEGFFWMGQYLSQSLLIILASMYIYALLCMVVHYIRTVYGIVTVHGSHCMHVYGSYSHCVW